jgi:hypothetical protein
MMRVKAGTCRVWLTGLILQVLASTSPTLAQSEVFTVLPNADTFVWAVAPTNNYGGAGALNVSGTEATNGMGVKNGLFDSLLRFPLSNVVVSLNNDLGAGSWVVTQVRLVVNEMANPDNNLFNRGTGAFEVRWLAADGWVEGSGRPITPTTDGVVWNDLAGLMNSNLDASLGIFTNANVNSPISFTLALEERFVAEIRQGNEVSLHLTAAGPGVGFTFNSRNFGNTNIQPTLEITAEAAPHPLIQGIVVEGDLVSIRFEAFTNRTCRLQGANDAVASGAAQWQDLLVVPPQPATGTLVYHEGITNRQRLYRLSVGN